MTTTNLLWTALPNGGTSGAYALSLYVSPRLEGMGPTGLLQDYDLGNWPKILQTVFAQPGALKAELAGLGLVPLSLPQAYLDGLEPTLWEAIFPADETLVTPRQFQDHAKRWLRSFSVRPIEAYIQGLYDTVANGSPHTFPDLKGNTPVTELTEVMGRAMAVMRKGLPAPRDPKQPKRYDPVPQRGRATHPDAVIEAELTSLAATLGASHIPVAELFRAYRFYRRGNHLPYRSKDEPRDVSLISDRPKEPKFDFHKAMAALGDHPALLRKLGLIVDCVLPIKAEDLVKSNQLQIVPVAHAPVGDITPWTRYVLSTATGFRPEPRKGGDLAEGMLRLDDAKVFDVIQTDPDGNVIKVFDYAVNMHKVRSDLLAQKAKNPQAKSSQAPEETSLPALRSGGLTITRLARDNKLWDHLALQSNHESNPENAVLFADDVLRGYRVDVNFRGKWFSLCRWQGEYEVAGKRFPAEGPAEGYMKADSASSDDGPTAGPQKPDLYVHEALVAWRNWSLVARQPGKTIVPVHDEINKRQTEEVQHRENTPGAGFSVATNFKAEPLSLPPLRYGEKYQLRARAVDLAGNSLAPPPSPKDPTPAGDPAPVGVGESTAVRYLRYDPVPAPALVLTKPVKEGESVETMVIRNPSTHMPVPLPPAVGLDETTLYNPTNARWVAPPKSTVGEAETHGLFDTLFKTPQVAFDVLKKESGSFDDPASGATIVDITGAEVAYPPKPDYRKGDPLPDGMYIVHKEDPVALPYLPDALAHGVALMPLQPNGVPTGQVLHKAYAATSWPDRGPFKLVLVESAGPAGFELDGGEALAKLPRGTMLRVRYASAIVPPDSGTPGELDLMGRWHKLSNGPTGGKALMVANGYQHWMITPWRTLTLVHAVQKPMAPSVLNKLSVSRQPGDTFVNLRNGHVHVQHAPSTGELALRGQWNDHVDDPLDEEGPKVLPRDGHVLDRKVDYDEEHVLIPPPNDKEQPRHEFGDTKHRWVDYYAVGTTRYREYFPHALTEYEDPTTKKKLITVDGPTFQQNVKSSARPLPPEVLYIVPTFKWVNTANGRQRKGRGLRIYLKRGWFSSGVDELLGVVLMPGGLYPSGVVDQFREYVSQWGSDPIFDKDGPTSWMSASHFTHDPAFPDSAPQLPVAENVLIAEKNMRVRVLGFKPQWDGDRKLWFVDLEMNLPDAYNTFVRFGLCRYQPHSLQDLEISKIVRAEFSQLLPDRNASLVPGDRAIDVTVWGTFALNKLGIRWNGDDSAVPVPLQLPGARADVLAQPSAKPGVTVAAPGLVPGPIQPPIIQPPALVPNPDAGSAHMVVAQIEWRPQSSSSDLDWQPLDGGQRLSPYTTLLSTSTVYWKTAVRWPRPNAPKNREYRLVLREYELYQTDAEAAEPLAINNPTGVPIRSRLVYVDVFPLAAP